MDRLLHLFLVLVVLAPFQSLTLITQGQQIFDAQWSPTGDHIAYAQLRDATGVIYRLEGDGSQSLPLTGAIIAQMPRLSPDGSKVIYVRLDGDDVFLHIVNVDGSQDKQLLKLFKVPTTLEWSPDASKILIHTDRLFVIDPNGSELYAISGGIEDNRHVWSPDSQRIAFVRTNSSDIWVMNADGSNLEAIFTVDDTPLTLAWSPDQQKIAFEYSQTNLVETPDPHDPGYYEETTFELGVILADGSGFTSVAGLDTASFDGFSWSPDSTRLSYARYSEVFVTTVEGDQPSNLTNSASNESQPVWSPDGSKIAFVSDSDNPAEIYVVEPESGDAERLTFNDTDEQSIAWAPDSAFILFEGSRPTRDAITSIELQSSVQRVLSAQLDVLLYSFSPDGRTIAFATREGNPDLYVVNVDGSGLTRLARNGFDHSWSPNGRYLAFLDGSTIYVFDTNSALVTRVAVGAFIANYIVEIEWSPDSRQIAFLGKIDALSEGDIYTINRDGSNLTKFANAGMYSRLAWSPTSRNLAAFGQRNGKPTISLVDVDSQNVSTLVDVDAGSVLLMQWSPDGSKLLYLTFSSEGSAEAAPLEIAQAAQSSDVVQQMPVSETYVINADGTGHRVVSDIGRWPSWSPDSHWLMWSDSDGIAIVAPDGSQQHFFPLPNLSGAQWAPSSYHILYVQRVEYSEFSDANIFVMPLKF